MKKIWLFIARITGAEKHIRENERELCGEEIVQGSYWYSATSKYGILFPLLYDIGHRMKRNCSTYGHHERSEVDLMLTLHEQGKLDEYLDDRMNFPKRNK